MVYRKENHDHPPPRYYVTIRNDHPGQPLPNAKMTSTMFVLSLDMALPPGFPNPVLLGPWHCRADQLQQQAVRALGDP